MYNDVQSSEVDRLAQLAYGELKHIAARLLRDERTSHTLQPTALVHEAYLKIAQQESALWQNKSQFLAVAARCMRRILVDHARSRTRLKRGGPGQMILLDGSELFSKQRSTDLVWLDEALDRLSALDKRQSAIVEYRFFGGLSVDETAEILGITPKTVKRQWSLARAWLYGELKEHRVDTGDVEPGHKPV
jgi:RNA polymerase sigma-70 factor (ECF subfamily)